MKKLLILVAVSLILTNCSENSVEDESFNEYFKFTQIFIVQADSFMRGETGQVKVFDSEDNLIAFENDYKINTKQQLNLGPQVIELWVRSFEVEINQDISDFLYIRINDNEYDQDDIQELIDNNCNILTLSPYSGNETFNQFVNEVYDVYCPSN
tara:strand:+ start:119 stop:580 length:462 start_codon:yes stop_codon:yes gene_type:complete